MDLLALSLDLCSESSKADASCFSSICSGKSDREFKSGSKRFKNGAPEVLSPDFAGGLICGSGVLIGIFFIVSKISPASSSLIESEESVGLDLIDCKIG